MPASRPAQARAPAIRSGLLFSVGAQAVVAYLLFLAADMVNDAERKYYRMIAERGASAASASVRTGAFAADQ